MARNSESRAAHDADNNKLHNEKTPQLTKD